MMWLRLCAVVFVGWSALLASAFDVVIGEDEFSFFAGDEHVSVPSVDIPKYGLRVSAYLSGYEESVANRPFAKSGVLTLYPDNNVGVLSESKNILSVTLSFSEHRYMWFETQQFDVAPVYNDCKITDKDCVHTLSVGFSEPTDKVEFYNMVYIGGGIRINRFEIEFDGDPSLAINDVEIKDNDECKLFDLQGRRLLSPPSAGKLYIRAAAGSSKIIRQQ